MLARSARSPVHAYLLAGPPGCGSELLGVALSAALVCPDAGCGTCRHCTLALAKEHPDVSWVVRSRAMLRYRSDTAQSEEWTVERVVREAALSPAEAPRRVFVVPELQLLQPDAVPALLKTVEEPPATTAFVLMADSLGTDLATVASRCLRVDLGLPPTEAVAQWLVERHGLDPDRSMATAIAAGSRLDRADLLAGDDDFATRLAAHAGLPARLDGTGATVATIVDELTAGLDEVADSLLDERHAAERQDVAEQIETYGMRRSLLDDCDHRQRQERRRVRTDELRVALGALAGTYRDLLVDGNIPLERAVAALDEIQRVAEALERNPNERLLLEHMFLHLSPVR